VRPALRALAVLSVLELLSVVLLLGNLATWHVSAVASALGPVHGALYLSVAVTALMARDLLRTTRIQALIPVAGGALTLRNVRVEAGRGHNA